MKVCELCKQEVKSLHLFNYVTDGFLGATFKTFDFCSKQCVLKFIVDNFNNIK